MLRVDSLDLPEFLDHVADFVGTSLNLLLEKDASLALSRVVIGLQLPQELFIL